MVKELRHHVKEDVGLAVTSDIKGTVGHFRNLNPCGLVEGNHATFSYWEAREVELGGDARVN